MGNRTLKNSKIIDRRSFIIDSLRGVGAGVVLARPLEIFLGNILMGVFQRAEGAILNDESFLDKKFINLTMINGPSRWFWDLPLTPNGSSDPFCYNSSNNPATSMLITRLDPGPGPSGFIGSYATVKVGNYHLPHLWNSKIPTADGGAVPMTYLAQNMLMMRGIDMLVDSHTQNRVSAVVPTSGGSLLGLVADVGKTVLPSIGVNTGITGGDYYQSRAGVPFQDMSNNNPLASAFAPFSVTNPQFTRTLQKDAGAVIEGALDIMRKNSGDKHRYLPSSYQDRINAKKLMLTQFNGLQGQFTSLKAKYEMLISRSMSDASLFLEGVEDRAIPSDKASDAFNIHISEAKGVRYDGNDLRSITNANSTVSNLAAGFAVAEYMICGDMSASKPQSFSSSLHIAIQDINAFVDQAFNLNNNTAITNGTLSLTPDAHETGSFVQLIQFTRFYRSISACLYEFIQQLKARQVSNGTLFDNSVISITSEFNRSARDNAGGADHGWAGSAYSILSGMIPSLMVAGNIKVNESGRGGTWGIAEKMDEFSGQTGLIGNPASTVAELLELKSPTPNNPSYVFKDKGDKATLKVGRPQNRR